MLGRPITPASGSSRLAVLLSLVVSLVTTSWLSAQEQGRPDLSRLSAEEQAMIARACNLDQRVGGPAKYYACLRGQLATLRNSPGEPDLSRLSAEEQAMIARACNLDQRVGGPAKYYDCLRGQLAARRPWSPDRSSQEESPFSKERCFSSSSKRQRDGARYARRDREAGRGSDQA